MSEPVAKTHNVPATISWVSAAVGFLIIPILLAPVAIIAGVVGLRHDGATSGAAVAGIIIGILEILYMFGQWASAGLFG